MTDFVRERSRKFPTVHSQLAAAYLEHKDDLGDLGVSLDDAEIIKGVDEITALLFAGTVQANPCNNHRWLKRYQRFAALMDDFIDDAPVRPLEG